MERNLEKIISETRKNLNPRYDITVHDMTCIKESSNEFFDLISNSFLFGYAQGTKAARKELERVWKRYGKI